MCCKEGQRGCVSGLTGSKQIRDTDEFKALFADFEKEKMTFMKKACNLMIKTAELEVKANRNNLRTKVFETIKLAAKMKTVELVTRDSTLSIDGSMHQCKNMYLGTKEKSRTRYEPSTDTFFSHII